MCKIYIADFPKADCSTFHGRLNFILSRAGYVTEHEKISKLSKASGRTARTVKKWLIGQSFPNDHFKLHKVLKAVDYTGCLLWLMSGKTRVEFGDIDPWQKDIATKMQNMSEWQKSKFLRMTLRLLNNDKKVNRLIAQRDAGLISQDRFLSLM